MTVKELIEKLSVYHPQTLVFISQTEQDEEGEEYTLEDEPFIYECCLENKIWIY